MTAKPEQAEQPTATAPSSATATSTRNGATGFTRRWKPTASLRAWSATKPHGAGAEALYPIFRDREELPTATSLGEQIEQALEHSDYLIVICSPRSAKSMWVNEEILQFKRLGRSDRILAIIVDGEPNASDKPGLEEQECFPPALRFELGEDGELSDVRTEPIAADARKGKDGKQAAKLKLVAGLLGVKYDALAQRDKRRRRIQRASAGAFATIALVAFAGLWYYGETSRKAEERARLLGESQRLAELAEQEIEAGFYDRAALLALNGLPGIYGGNRPLSQRASAACGAHYQAYGKRWKYRIRTVY